MNSILILNLNNHKGIKNKKKWKSKKKKKE